MAKKPKIPAETKNYIEMVLSTYPLMKSRLEAEYKLQKAIQEDGKRDVLLSALSPIALCNLEYSVKAIEDTIQGLNDVGMYIFQRRYIDRCTDRKQIAAEIPVAVETYQRAKRRIIEEAGRRLGVLWDE